MQDKEHLIFDDKSSYVEMCLKMPPSDRLKKGFELVEWSAQLNKYHQIEVEKRLLNYYLLK